MKSAICLLFRITSHKDLLSWVISTWQSLTGVQASSDSGKVGNTEAMETETVVEDKEAERKR